MSTPYDVTVFVGSLRAASLNRLVARALAALAPTSFKLTIVEIGDLPMYNQDLESDPPASWVAFRDRVKLADAVLFVTPEYNRSVPAVMKNAVDVGSRPYAANVWSGKPGAVVSVTPGALGAFGANHHLRQSLVAINVATMAQPEAYLSHAASFFDESGKLTDDRTRKFLTTFMEAFAAWIEANVKG